MKDNGGRRLEQRRKFSYHHHVPERRSGHERRSGLDRRIRIDQRKEWVLKTESCNRIESQTHENSEENSE